MDQHARVSNTPHQTPYLGIGTVPDNCLLQVSQHGQLDLSWGLCQGQLTTVAVRVQPYLPRVNAMEAEKMQQATLARTRRWNLAGTHVRHGEAGLALEHDTASWHPDSELTLQGWNTMA
jgi:hypothetical protein